MLTSSTLGAGPERKSLAGRLLGLFGEEKDAFKSGGKPSASSDWRVNLLLGPHGVPLWADLAAESNRLGI